MSCIPAAAKESVSANGLNFSDLERQLPWIFFALYAIFLIGVVMLIFRL